MIASSHRLPLLMFAIVTGAACVVSAEESFESHLRKLNDDRYAVRVESRDALVVMCRKKPQLLDALAPVLFDEKEDIERVLLAREVVREAIFVERGAVGFALDHNLVVVRLVENGPAANAGIRHNFKLLSFGGQSVEGKNPDQVYAMIHASAPGTKLDMELLTPEGEKVVLHPVVVARQTIRADEDSAARKQQLYDQWMERKREELGLQED